MEEGKDRSYDVSSETLIEMQKSFNLYRINVTKQRSV